MNAILKIAGLLALIICFSCEGKAWFVNCTDCQENEPVETNVKIKLSENGAPVEIKIFEGNLEDNILYAKYNANGSELTVPAGLNQIYTFTATYNVGSKTYIAVNSAMPGVKYETSQCEDPCYFVYGNVVDLRLKYTGK